MLAVNDPETVIWFIPSPALIPTRASSLAVVGHCMSSYTNIANDPL